jgi:hypothetical protein
MKYSRILGIAAALILAGATLLPWAWFPDLQKDFTGWYSEGNAYGRPGKIYLFLIVASIILFFIPKLWAVRVNNVITAIALAFGIKCFLLFGACYRGICPDRKIGLYLALLASAAMFAMSLFPNIKLKEEKP